MFKFGKNRSSLVPLLTLLATAAPTVAQTAVSSGFTYQGRLNLSGQPVDGSADLQFSLFDAATLGNPVGTTQTVLNANVVDGLFTTQLDFGADAFAGSSRWIEIAVRSPAGSGGYTTLDPRQRLTAAPVAWYAMRPWIPLNGNFYLPLPAEGNGVGIGLSAPVTRLHVRAPAFFPAETMRIDDFFGRSQLRIATPESAGKVGLQAWNGQTNTAGTLAFNLGGGSVGIGTDAPSARLDVVGAIEADGFRLNGNGAAFGNVMTCDAGGSGVWAPPQWTTNGAHIGYPGAGNVGIGMTSPNLTLDVRNNGMLGTSSTSVNQHDVTNRGNKASFGYQPVSTTEFVGMRSVIAAGTNGCGNTADIRFDTWECQTSISREVMRINGSGNVGIGTTTPVSKLDVVGTVTADGLLVAGAGTISATVHPAALVESSSTAGTWLNLRNSSVGGRFWQFISTGSGNGQGAGKLLIGRGASAGVHDLTAMTVDSDGDVGIGTTAPAAKLDVIGTARVSVLQITGGADVAEPFNINSDEATERRSDEGYEGKVEPGYVVSIDPAQVGELRLSSTAYDKTVAGVISGANGINPGMVLTQTGSVADGKHPVALTGRVWCWCDADAGGAITAGDMLTTSDTPGHAMRVADHDLAHGAVIGKAMSALESGKGMVLVLVNLQ